MDDLLKTISYQNKEIILIGTAHVSSESVEFVKDSILNYQPEAVCLELDENRYHSLANQTSWEKTDLFQLIKDNQALYLIIQLYLTAYQKNIAKHLDTTPGQEMLTASEIAKSLNIPIFLVDRDIQITFKRLFSKLSAKEKIKLVSSLLSDEKESFEEDDIIALMASVNLTESITALEDELPSLAEVILYERNRYMIEKIKKVPHKKIMVILGAAHLPGIIEEFETSNDLNELDSLPKKKISWSWLKWLIPIIIITLLVYSFVINFNLGIRNLTIWILVNGGLASLFALISKAHPLSIIVAFFSAPLTSINPVLASGFFVSFVELKLRPATVKDFENIFEDINTLKGWYHNKALKALMTLIMTNLGSTIGTIISATKIITNK